MEKASGRGFVQPEGKQALHDFWNRSSCGEVYAGEGSTRERYDRHAQERYRLESYIRPFARFEEGAGLDVLEIGIGMGADHLEWARSKPRRLVGVDLTDRAIEHTRSRFSAYGFESHVETADAEALPFDDATFDIVYSYGVLHHSPNTQQAINEAYRVLKPGGTARVMIYHKFSLVGYMLWVRYALLLGKPLTSLETIYAERLESPGTKAFTVVQARRMFGRFERVNARVQLSFGDLLEGAVGQRHGGIVLDLARRLWPRTLIRNHLGAHGLALFVEAKK